jgi:hypothetical protein
MIDPMTAYQAFTALKGFKDKQDKADAQQFRYEQNRINAVAARDLKIQALNTRAIQESEAVSEDKMALAIKALETKEKQKVAAGEAGVGAGKTAKQITDLTEARKLRGISKYNASIDRLLTQVELEKAGVNAEAMNRINSLQQGVQPSLGEAALQFAGNAMASDIKYGDGKMFGINLIGDKNVASLTKFGTADAMKPLPSGNDIPFALVLK